MEFFEKVGEAHNLLRIVVKSNLNFSHNACLNWDIDENSLWKIAQVPF